MNAVRLGVVGVGDEYTGLHRPVIDAQPDHYQAVAMYDPDPSRMLNAATRTNAAAYESLDDLLKNPQVEAVLITTSVSSRFDILQRALNAGKHTIVERPMAGSAVQCDQLLALARRRGLLLTSTHFRRWDHLFVHARTRIQGGEVGDPVLIKLAAAVPAGTDALFGDGFDLLDYALILNDSPLIEVSAVPNLSRSGATDTLAAVCRFEKNPAVEITFAVAAPNALFPLPRLVVIGTRSAFADTSMLNNPDPQPFYDGLWRAIRERGAPPVVAASSRNTVYLAESLLGSMRSGGAVRTERLLKAVE